ncbi:MAG: hypothetical protein ABIJ75_07955 [Actinomycetota bacterium]
MTAHIYLVCIVAGFLLIGLGIWYYGPNGPDSADREHPPCLACGEYEPDHMPGCALAPRFYGLRRIR